MTSNDSQRDADRLYTFLKAGVPAGALTSPEAELASALKATAQRIQPDAKFEAALEQRLAHAPRPPRTRRFSAPSLARLGRFLVWASMAAALLFGLVWIFQNALPPTRPAAVSPATTTPIPTPGVETATPSQPAGQDPPATPAPIAYSSHLTEGGLVLKAAFPTTPANVQVYQQLPLETLSVENARQVASQLGIDGPVYRSPYGNPGSTNYIVTDGLAEISFSGSPLAFSYYRTRNTYHTALTANDYPPTDTLIAQAKRFLEAGGLLDFPYQVISLEDQPGSVQFLPVLDNIPVRFEMVGSPDMTVTFDPQGQITNISSDRLAYQPAGSFPIISAEQAWQQFLADNTQAGVLANTMGSMKSDYQTWRPQYTSGQQVELFGYVTVYPAVEPGNEPYLSIDGFQVVGKTTGMAEASKNITFMQVWGVFETGDKGQLQFNVSGWQKSNFADRAYIGTVTRQGEKAYLHTDSGETMLMPGLPADVPQDVQVTAQGALVEQPEPTLVWSSVSRGQGSGGGGGGGMTFAALNLSGEPGTPAAPTETPLPAPSERVKPEQRVEGVQGDVWVMLYQYNDGVQKARANLMIQDGPDLLEGLVVDLTGPAMEGIEAYHQLPVKVWGAFQSTDGNLPVLSVERIEPIYPGLKPRVWFGTSEVITLDGREVILFTDEETGGEFILRTSIDTPDPEELPWEADKRVAVEGLALPGETFAGYSVVKDLTMLPSSDDREQYQPSSAVPPVIPEEIPSTEAKLATIEKIELIYYTEDPQHSAPEGQTIRYVQPVWRFSGHYNTGQTVEILVQALVSQYLK